MKNPPKQIIDSIFDGVWQTYLSIQLNGSLLLTAVDPLDLYCGRFFSSVLNSASFIRSFANNICHAIFFKRDRSLNEYLTLAWFARQFIYTRIQENKLIAYEMFLFLLKLQKKAFRSPFKTNKNWFCFDVIRMRVVGGVSFLVMFHHRSMSPLSCASFWQWLQMKYGVKSLPKIINIQLPVYATNESIGHLDLHSKISLFNEFYFDSKCSTIIQSSCESNVLFLFCTNSTETHSLSTNFVELWQLMLVVFTSILTCLTDAQNDFNTRKCYDINIKNKNKTRKYCHDVTKKQMIWQLKWNRSELVECKKQAVSRDRFFFSVERNFSRRIFVTRECTFRAHKKCTYTYFGFTHFHSGVKAQAHRKYSGWKVFDVEM